MFELFKIHNLFMPLYQILISAACGFQPSCLSLKIVCKIVWSPKSASELRMMLMGSSTLLVFVMYCCEQHFCSKRDRNNFFVNSTFFFS